MNETESPPTPSPPPGTTRRLERAREGRMVAGVCEGLGRYFDVDPVIFRIGFAVAALAGGAGIIGYIVAALVIPEEGSRRAALHFGRRTPTLVIWGLAALAFIALADGLGRGPFHFGWGLFVLAGAGWLIWSHEQRHPRSRASDPAVVAPPPTESRSGAGFGDETATLSEDRDGGMEADEPRPRSILTRLTLSVLLVGAGVALAVAQQADDVTGRGVEAVVAGGLLVVGAALLVGAWFGRAKALIVLGVLFTFAAASASVVDVPLKGGVGDRTWTPVASVRPAYRLGAGDATLDLSRIEGDEVTTEVSVGAGNLQVFVPSDATVDVDAHAGLGDLRVFGRHTNGFDLDREVTARGSELGPRIHLRVRLGVGSVEIVRDERFGSQP